MNVRKDHDLLWIMFGCHGVWKVDQLFRELFPRLQEILIPTIVILKENFFLGIDFIRN